MQTHFPEMVLTSNQCHIINSRIEAEFDNFEEATHPDSSSSIFRANSHLRMGKNLFEGGRKI